MKLVIVESPTKARTISKFLSKDYKIESSFGHIRDLPKSKLGIDVEKNFEPSYVIPTKARKTVNALKKQAKESDLVILATDEDREGEAISYHLVKALELDKAGAPKIQRITFHEITENAIKSALQSPREIDTSLVDAQQARRILDRLVGYKLSPFLWEKVAKRLSAGRVQSVALRLICEREAEIKKFQPEEYWTIIATLLKAKSKNFFEASLVKINKKTMEKFSIKTKEDADKIVSSLKQSEFSISGISKKEVRKNPLPPFTTSTLQQASVKRLRFSAKQTMRLAQNLYENGHITYMRTDSLNLSKESVNAAKSWLVKNLGEKYASDAPRFYKTKSKMAQEAHEAIKPTNISLTPENLGAENSQEKKLYEMIWQRFMASQMPQAIFEAAVIEIEAKNKKETFGLRANGNVLKFDGFLKIWPSAYEEKELPELDKGDALEQKEISGQQHFTEPPARYDEASLVKTLEEFGIGRPSTYAPIISVIQDRYYVLKNEQRRFQPTEIGEAVNKMLTENFPDIVDVNFTATIEDQFDQVAEGRKKWQKVIKEFYEPFAKNLEKKYEKVEKQEPIKETTNEVCEKCGKPMAVKYSRYGKFLACTGYPECKNTKSLSINGGNAEAKDFGACPKCGAESGNPPTAGQPGKIVMKRTKKGRFFYGCNKWPDCDYASWTKPETNQESKSEIQTPEEKIKDTEE